MSESQHFKTNTWVVINNHRGEILAVETEKWPVLKRYLRIAWEDGTVSRIEPIALSHHFLRSHRENISGRGHGA